MGYDFTILYKSGRTNLAADALSRAPAASFQAISGRQFDWIEQLRHANIDHPELVELHNNFQSDTTKFSDFCVRDGLLLYKGRLVLPSDSPMRLILLKEFHSSAIGGHAGVSRTFQCVASNFYWKGMRHNVHTYVASCQTCQQMKDILKQPAGFLQPLPIPALVLKK